MVGGGYDGVAAALVLGAWRAVTLLFAAANQPSAVAPVLSQTGKGDK
jgi:hypothetical protein